MSIIVDIAIKTLIAYILAVGLCMMLLAAELAFPRGEQPDPRERLRAAKFVIIATPATVSATMPIFWGLEYFGVRPMLPILPDFGFLLSAAITFLMYDFFYYWLHRAQHRLPVLWRVHEVHHSIEKMGAPTGYHHILQPFLEAACCALPLMIFIDTPYLGFAAVLTGLHGYYVHSVTKINFGPLAGVFVDNRVHRIHHSREQAHMNRNFAVVFTFWDRLFGTAYLPSREEWPTVGLADRSEPQGVAEYLMRPFTRTRGDAADVPDGIAATAAR